MEEENGIGMGMKWMGDGHGRFVNIMSRAPPNPRHGASYSSNPGEQDFD